MYKAFIKVSTRGESTPTGRVLTAGRLRCRFTPFTPAGQKSGPGSFMRQMAMVNGDGDGYINLDIFMVNGDGTIYWYMNIDDTISLFMGMGQWSKIVKAYSSHRGNKHPLTSYFRVSRVPGFWLIAIYHNCICMYIYNPPGVDVILFFSKTFLFCWGCLKCPCSI